LNAFVKYCTLAKVDVILQPLRRTFAEPLPLVTLSCRVSFLKRNAFSVILPVCGENNPEEARNASSKQKIAGTMVNQFKKERFPLQINMHSY
jgi:hypothetical protein